MPLFQVKQCKGMRWWERRQPRGRTLPSSLCSMWGPSALCTPQMCGRGRPPGPGPDGELASLVGRQIGSPWPLGSESCLFGSRCPTFSSFPQHLGVIDIEHFWQSSSTGSELLITGAIPEIRALPNSGCREMASCLQRHGQRDLLGP